jgi:hypothetical protein
VYEDWVGPRDPKPLSWLEQEFLGSHEDAVCAIVNISICGNLSEETEIFCCSDARALKAVRV